MNSINVAIRCVSASPHNLPLCKAIASIVVIVIISGSDMWTRFNGEPKETHRRAIK